MIVGVSGRKRSPAYVATRAGWLLDSTEEGRPEMQACSAPAPPAEVSSVSRSSPASGSRPGPPSRGAQGHAKGHGAAIPRSGTERARLRHAGCRIIGLDCFLTPRAGPGCSGGHSVRRPWAIRLQPNAGRPRTPARSAPPTMAPMGRERGAAPVDGIRRCAPRLGASAGSASCPMPVSAPPTPTRVGVETNTCGGHRASVGATCRDGQGLPRLEGES